MTAPAHASGPVDVVVTNPDGQTATLPGAFTYNAGPTIVSVTPDSGPSAGGTTVTITGTGFGGPGTTVTVDGTSASLDGGSSTSVTFFTPSHVAGTVDVVVSNPDGQQAVAAGAFTHRDGPTLQTITPSQGPAAGGTPVTITGSGFGGPATTVTFGGVTATIESRSATTLDVISPAHASGPVDVVVTNPDGQQAIATTGFLYVPAPSIQSVSPVSGTALGGTQSDGNRIRFWWPGHISQLRRHQRNRHLRVCNIIDGDHTRRTSPGRSMLWSPTLTAKQPRPSRVHIPGGATGTCIGVAQTNNGHHRRRCESHAHWKKLPRRDPTDTERPQSPHRSSLSQEWRRGVDELREATVPHECGRLHPEPAQNSEASMNSDTLTVDPTSPADVSATPQPPQFPTARPGMGFNEASAAVVDYLKTVLPMGFWAVTRFDGMRQLYLEVRDDSYGLGAGGSHLWEDSFCVNMVADRAPQIAPDAMSIPEYAAAGVAKQIDIGAYVGIPIMRPDGELFGTLCGLDPAPQSDDILQHAPLLHILGMLLSTILEADLERTRQARLLERAEMVAECDQLTGLFNRRGWNRYMEIEEARFRRFGDPGAVIVIDLDGLKEINDTLGHHAGDELIKLAGSVIRDTIRDCDIAARLGGDEFGIIASNVVPADCDVLVARILEGFHDAGVSGSIGHAAYTVVAGFPGAFVAADESMYAEKRRRRAARLAGG